MGEQPLRLEIHIGMGEVMKLVYIAAPFTADTSTGIAHNIARAAQVAAWVNKHGEGKLFAVCPHTLTAQVSDLHPMPIEFWYAGTLEVCLACPVLIRLIGKSTGSDAEVQWHKAKYPDWQFYVDCTEKSVEFEVDYILHRLERL